MKRFLPACLLILTSCGGGEETPPDILAAKAAVKDQINKFHDLYDKGKVDELLEVLSPDCRIKSGVLSFAEGKEKAAELIRKQLEQLVSEEALEGRRTRLGDVHVRIKDKVAWGSYDAGVSDKRGQHEVQVSFVYQYHGGTWLLAHYHDDWRK